MAAVASVDGSCCCCGGFQQRSSLSLVPDLHPETHPQPGGELKTACCRSLTVHPPPELPASTSPVSCMGQKNSNGNASEDNLNRNEYAGQDNLNRNGTSRRRRGSSSLPSENHGVSFNEKISVVLIPSRAEFNALKLTEKIWWSNAEFLETKKAAEDELIGALSLEDTLTSGDAVQMLYQLRFKDGLFIVHVLITSLDSKFLSLLFTHLKKAHKKAGLQNRLLIQQACSIEELYVKLNTCVDFNAVFIDKNLLSTHPQIDILDKIRSRHQHTCIVVVRQHGNGEYGDGNADYYWTMDGATGFVDEWKEVLLTSELRNSESLEEKDRRLSATNSDSSLENKASYALLASEVDEQYCDIPLSISQVASRQDLACVVLERKIPITITACNKAWTSLCGHSASFYEGQDISIFVGPKTDMTKLSTLQASIERGSPASTFLILYPGTGSEFICYIRGLAMSEQLYVCVFERIER